MGRIIGIIPSRWASGRFPGKSLALIAGKSLLQRVWERCNSTEQLDDIVIATDDERIVLAAKDFGGKTMMTSADHQNGTDRIAEVVSQLPEDFTHVINIQGDEPLIDPALIDRIASTMRDEPQLPMITAAAPILDRTELGNPNCVKVVINAQGNALYFSRHPIPYSVAGISRSEGELFPTSNDGNASTIPFLRHHGIYGYSRSFLERYVKWEPSPLEMIERLEQLRALENGAIIRVLRTNHQAVGVDVPADVKRVEALLHQEEYRKSFEQERERMVSDSLAETTVRN